VCLTHRCNRGPDDAFANLLRQFTQRCAVEVIRIQVNLCEERTQQIDHDLVVLVVVVVGLSARHQ
jgi:hypothetical protein